MKKKMAVFSIFLFIIAISSGSPGYSADAKKASGNKANLKEEINSLKKEINELRKDVEDLKTKAAAAKQAPAEEMPEPLEVTVNIDDDVVLGNNDAPVTIIEFSDYQCPFCRRHFKNTFSEIERDYIKTGKVKYVFRDFPLDFHKQAPKAAEAAHCAGDQGRYWDMHNKIFDNQSEIQVENLKKYAADIGLDAGSFNSCLDSGKYVSEIEKDTDDGRKIGVSGTPTFFIGKSRLNSNEITGIRIVGARPLSSFKPVIDQLLQTK